MKKLGMMVLLLFCLFAAGCFQQPQVGDSEEQVMDVWGVPARQMQLTTGPVWVYQPFGWGTPSYYLSFRNGRVSQIKER